MKIFVFNFYVLLHNIEYIQQKEKGQFLLLQYLY